ncbi:MAG: ABC transporter ATP-binding protein [Gemmatimonadaceae bacterium]
MSSSRKPDDLPPALSSMWRLCRLGLRFEPGLMTWAFSLALLSALPDALLALWFKLMADAALAGDRTRLGLTTLALGVSAAGTWFLRTVSTRVQRRFRDKVTIALEAHVARLQASITTIAHQEVPEYLDRIAMLRNQVFVLDHMYMAVFSMAGWILRLVITIALLVSVHPALILLGAFALPTVFASSWRPAVERAAQERAAPFNRLARHLFTIGTTAPAAKEVRLTGITDRLTRDRRRAWDTGHRSIAAARWGSMAWYVGAWTIFAAGYVASVVFVSAVVHVSVGAVLLVLAAGARLSWYVGATVGELGFLRGFWVYGARRLAWLEDYAASSTSAASLTAPTRLERGIRFDHVSFAYPGTQRLVLEDVKLDLPAGAVVAIVGENGAGKSTLVKLLARMYEPTSGQILIDETPLARITADSWRERMAGAFQDFFRFELRALHSVGLGDVPRHESEPAVATAVGRAGADDVVARLGAGLDTQLGPTWPEGIDVSFGQWQKLALARGFMRDGPLVLVLDEPTSALDSETEHALFERYAAAARSSAGRITILVSHRFSTVRMADLIVVMQGAHVVDVGSHEALIARGGLYEELYGIQAAAYR